MNRKDALSGLNVTLSRRQVLFAGLVMAAGTALTSALPAFALPASNGSFANFMALSRLLVNHQLDEGVGLRMMAQLEQEQPALASAVSQILAIATAHNATIVEEFFPAIPEGKLKALAHTIIFGWYTGCLSSKRGVKAFAFEQALTYHTTLDVITIPSYGISGPNNWSRPNAPVAAMPRF